MDLAFLLVAFGLGYAATLVRLPPLVGYLAAGFVLNAFGHESTDAIEAIADIGILLLLFGIGLKLDIRTLGRPEVYGTASVFAVIATVVPAGVLLIAAAAGLPLAEDLDLETALFVAFGLSFSSTVFAIKAMERTNETDSLSGRTAIGVLIVQDVLAVAFIVLLGAEWPSPWLIAVVAGTLVARPALAWLMSRCGHGELSVLFGFVMALGVGAELFDAVDLKPDLGALFIGVVLAGKPRAGELANRLLAFKDLFLIGFFLSIGLDGTPSSSAWFIGVMLVVLVPTRSTVLFFILTRYRLRARTALHTALTLSTFSEFGLIVVSAIVDDGRLDRQWLAVLAVAVSGSFIVASASSAARYRIYDRWQLLSTGLERHPPIDEDAVIDIGPARVLIFGMGRIGTGAYDELVQHRGPVVGVDRETPLVEMHCAEGRRVFHGDALDRDFWERISVQPGIELALAVTSNHRANLECVRRIREFLPDARIASIAMYPDQVRELQEAGVDVARNLFEEAGQALAIDAVSEIWPE